MIYYIFFVDFFATCSSPIKTCFLYRTPRRQTRKVIVSWRCTANVRSSGRLGRSMADLQDLKLRMLHMSFVFPNHIISILACTDTGTVLTASKSYVISIDARIYVELVIFNSLPLNLPLRKPSHRFPNPTCQQNKLFWEALAVGLSHRNPQVSSMGFVFPSF